MKDSMELFSNQQLRDWLKLQNAIDEAPEQIPCINFPDAFFPDEQRDDGKQLNRHHYVAKQWCHTCPVIAQCAEYAMKHEDFGLWGGMSARERSDIKSGRRVA